MASARRRRSLERVKAGHGRRRRRLLLGPEVVVVVAAVEERPTASSRLSHEWNVVVVVAWRWQSEGRRTVHRTRVDALHLVHGGGVSSGAVFAALATAEQIVQVDVDVAGVLPGDAHGSGRGRLGLAGRGSVAQQEVVVVGGVQGLRLEETNAAGWRKE